MIKRLDKAKRVELRNKFMNDQQFVNFAQGYKNYKKALATTEMEAEEVWQESLDLLKRLDDNPRKEVAIQFEWDDLREEYLTDGETTRSEEDAERSVVIVFYAALVGLMSASKDYCENPNKALCKAIYGLICESEVFKTMHDMFRTEEIKDDENGYEADVIDFFEKVRISEAEKENPIIRKAIMELIGKAYDDKELKTLDALLRRVNKNGLYDECLEVLETEISKKNASTYIENQDNRNSNQFFGNVTNPKFKL